MSNSPTARRKPRTVRAVSSFVPDIVKAVFRSHGFPSAALLTDWPQIAGADLASFTRPEKIMWPRRNEADAVAEEPVTGRGQRRGATLVLRADGPRAIEVQFMAAQILERINGYFGYGAITELRIVQAPIGSAKRRPKAEKPRPRPAAAEPVPGFDNAGLGKALGRLGATIGKA
ncbi:MAG: DUF721 domain-containing protein [Hyphomicrobiales bacterium]